MDGGRNSVKIVRRDKKDVLIVDGHSYVAGERTIRQSDSVPVYCWTCVQDCGATVNTVVVDGKHVLEGAEEKAALQRSRARKVAAVASMHRRNRSVAQRDMHAVMSPRPDGSKYYLPPHLWK